MSEERIDLMDNAFFRLGVETGRKQVMDHIQHQCSLGKPIEANGELYWLTDAQQHLQDVMDGIDDAWNEEHREKKYIVPIKFIHNDREVIREVLISADEPQTAMLIAMGDFQSDGWIVDEDFENYKQI